MVKEIHNDVSRKRAISPVSVADDTAQVSQIIDAKDARFITWVIALGALADADATFATSLQNGNAVDDEATPTSITDSAAIAANELINPLSDADFQFDDDNKVLVITQKVTKRWNTLTITPSNNSGAALISAVAEVYGGNYLPAA